MKKLLVLALILSTVACLRPRSYSEIPYHLYSKNAKPLNGILNNTTYYHFNDGLQMIEVDNYSIWQEHIWHLESTYPRGADWEVDYPRPASNCLVFRNRKGEIVAQYGECWQTYTTSNFLPIDSSMVLHSHGAIQDNPQHPFGLYPQPQVQKAHWQNKDNTKSYADFRYYSTMNTTWFRTASCRSTPDRNYMVPQGQFWGLLDTLGNWVIEPNQYLHISWSADTHQDDYYYLMTDEKKQIWVLDRNYEICWKNECYTNIRYLNQSIFAVYDNEKYRWALKHINGDMITDFVYEQSPLPFEANGLTLVTERQRLGYIDMKGKVLTPIQYDKVAPFSDGLALAVYRNQDTSFESIFQFVDSTGTEVIQLGQQYTEVYDFHNKRSIIKNEEGYGCINTLGEEVITPQYVYLSDYFGGRAFFQTKDTTLYGVVDTTGQILLAPSITVDEFYHFNLKTDLEKQADGTFKRIDKE